MKKLKIVLSLILLFLFCIFPVKINALEKEGKIILIDPGHGGIDGGASTKSGPLEKDLNLQISLKLRDALEKEGYKVYLTRETDEGLYSQGKTVREKKREDLKKRREMKKETNCHVFISIHQNMFPQSKCYGAQVWYSANDKSQLLANHVQEALKETIKDNNKRVSKPSGDDYLILRDDYDGASILIECGFLSNPEEERKLQTEEHQNLIVKGISLGLERYFEEIEKKA
ncbi:N-acetylmuramoyl-L-alanine amidase CwlD [Caproiciproducens sp. MSJ-32]|uniref:N-acetylmuramoyl-L-alanine amidase CwlD n=1 Tax=Caproiciproducens sp. MSJ-32 TaxID=2841527 RepID=UPI001C0FF498|nr:N-acetylmuramoyl-L-alanine amidase CwlD [Caproiciproducens sp. MSJ-32]MBU5455753.1 N-acetylmuramoyl-L-alanine amidase CwlD [Caproiciproducens sp. MSJ-32]